VSAIAQAVVAIRNNTPILVRDVAEVKFAPALRSGDALVMGKPGVNDVDVKPVRCEYPDGDPSR